jgi:putative glycerol-1-phosphate prenyltransferase
MKITEKVISVGYILIGCGSKTSVEYISQTEAIPPDKTDIVVATALAGEMLGLKMIYLEAGSGAENHVPTEMIRAVKKEISIPLAVGEVLRVKMKYQIYLKRAPILLYWATVAKITRNS